MNKDLSPRAISLLDLCDQAKRGDIHAQKALLEAYNLRIYTRDELHLINRMIKELKLSEEEAIDKINL